MTYRNTAELEEIGRIVFDAMTDDLEQECDKADRIVGEEDPELPSLFSEYCERVLDRLQKHEIGKIVVAALEREDWRLER